MTTVAMNNLWNYIQGLSLSASNQTWLANRLIEASRQSRKNTSTKAHRTFSEDRVLQTDLPPYTIEEINMRLDEAEADVAAGRVLSRAEVSKKMHQYIAEHK